MTDKRYEVETSKGTVRFHSVGDPIYNVAPIRQWRGDPVAYGYEAATHCPDCTGKRFAQRDDLGFVPESVKDNEGNGIGAIFPWDTSDWPEGIYCDDCHREISEPFSDGEAV